MTRGTEMQTKQRPVFLDLRVLTKSLPIPGIVSILHRISGVLLFILLPVLLCLLAGSLSSGDTFAAYKSYAAHPLSKLILIGLLWAFMHHLIAGIRFLLLDAHMGVELQAARKSARWVLISGIVSALVLGALLW